MKFRYVENFKKLTVQCPPKDYEAKNIVAYRWVFDKIEHKKNFTPRYFLAPSRDTLRIEAIEDENKRDKTKCEYLALSMFDSEINATVKFKKIKDKIGKIIYRALGTNIAVGDLTESDGVNENPNSDGHFNHHPVVDCDYEKRFIIIAKL